MCVGCFVSVIHLVRVCLKEVTALLPLCPQLALANFFEDGGDDDIATLPQPESVSVSRSTGPR